MLNRIILIGRLTKDPELRYTSSGIAVANFSIAVDRGFKGQDKEQQTDFFDIVTWRATAENCAEYLSKGRLIAVDGRLQTRKYQTQDGQNRTAYEVVAETVKFLEFAKKTSDGSQSSERKPQEAADSEPPAEDDDLPF